MFHSLLQEFLSYLEAERRYSPHTVEAYGRDLGQFAAFCAGDSAFNPALSTSSDVRAWVGSLADSGMAPATLRRKIQSVRAFYLWGVKDGKFQGNPAAAVTLPKKRKALPNFVKEEEMESLLSQPADDFVSRRRRIILELLYSLGLRQAELLALTDADVNRASGEIRVTGKRSKTRVVPLPHALADAIAQWQTLRDERFPHLPKPAPLIAGPHGAFSKSSLYRDVHEALQGTSTGRKSPHTLRHSFATSMINGGADLDAVREFLGHESLATTQIYTHLSVNELLANYRAAHPRTKK